MTTSHTSLRVLKKQADKIAKALKAARGADHLRPRRQDCGLAPQGRPEVRPRDGRQGHHPRNDMGDDQGDERGRDVGVYPPQDAGRPRPATMTDGIGLDRPKHCDDWSCPARISCARHFGRSSAYASMRREHESTGHGPGTWYFRGIKENCPRYEFDRPKKWLMPKPGDVTHVPRGYAF